ncbi:SRPBCC family protein [Haloarcula sp. S1CR25-12]|uniref:SRPBCC family protein n=1 Tax=Haloarcula saliterrae TaxID=2950534 RepID=A0ABU2FAY4_9EURY|nr:SRPBCC family protein [Haloarcula sp. S1CR25-12]MDS0258976.1 SRPBCC family protein [Haloarcula sp. S1CR25-12]
MGRILRETRIDAPRKRVFDLARHVEAHVETMPAEEAIGATGLLELGDFVTFRQRQFGVPFELTAEVTVMDRPNRFVDEQRAGVFGSLVHEHTFEDCEGGTLMRDSVRFAMPFGPLGKTGEPVARRRLQRLIDYHATALRAVAEGDEWQRFLND